MKWRGQPSQNMPELRRIFDSFLPQFDFNARTKSNDLRRPTNTPVSAVVNAKNLSPASRRARLDPTSLAPLAQARQSQRGVVRYREATRANNRRFLQQLDKHAACISDERMAAAGWTLVSRASSSQEIARVRAIVDHAIVAAWPECVWLTFDEASGALAIWRHRNPPLANPDGTAFPSATDIDHAVRVLQAVGIARAAQFTDEIARIRPVSAGSVRPIQETLDADQIHFEFVAERLRAFRPSWCP